MTPPRQTFANHARFYPWYHFVAIPILLINIVVATMGAVRAPSLTTVWGVILALGIGIGIAVARSQVLTVQNRIIRLEERQRLRSLLPPEDHAAIDALHVSDVVALRFASDSEVPALFHQVVTGEFAKPQEIKQAVKDWRPDHLRA
ncbi:MAG: hypothetical protein H7066_20190 [Cytophagaceae bacterium]|nr:hypothetical protein [Gemmatimonadaceae bacterium]